MGWFCQRSPLTASLRRRPKGLLPYTQMRNGGFWRSAGHVT